MNIVFQGQRIRRSTGSSNRALADAIMAKVKVQLIEGQYFDRAEEQSRTFKELMDRFEREHLVKLASRQTGQAFVKRFRAFFGERTLGEITPKLIVEYKSLRYAAGVKPASINRELTCLRKAFNLAKREWEWCRQSGQPRLSRKGRDETRPVADGRRGSAIARCLSVVVARARGVRTP
jgi:hypothetical protein